MKRQIILKIINNLSVWLLISKYDGKLKNGFYNTCGINIWNPLAWIVVVNISLCSACFHFFYYFYDTMKIFYLNNK